jgi:ankyrin repeat protein
MRVAVLFAATAFAREAEPLFDSVRSDDQVTVASLLKQGADPNARADDGATGLCWAALRGNTAIAAKLLEAGANPDLTNELGIGPLSLAITNGSREMVKLLLENGAGPNVARENGETPLMTAARLGQTDVMKMLLVRGANANAREKKFGQTALMWAAGQPESVRLLLEFGAGVRASTNTWDVKYTNYLPTTVTLGKTGIPWNNDGDYQVKKGGLNALFFAVQKNDPESTKILLEAGADVNSTSADGTTPLLAALFKWDPPEGTFVPGRGAPATAGSSQRFSPDLALARLLLDRGASINVADGSGYTPLHGGALAVAKAARSGAKQKSAYGQTAAALALGADDVANAGNMLEEALAIVRRLLEAGADPNRQSVYPTAGPAGDVRINPAPPGSSALHIAASSGSVPLVQLLADRGGNPNLVRKDGHTPLSVAVLAGDLGVIREIVARGGDVKARWNPQDKIPDPVEAITLARRDQTILHLAAIGGNPEILEFLYAKGAPLDARNSMGETPLDLADKQERYREAIERQGAEGDQEKLSKIVRRTAGSDALKRLAGKTGSR